MRCATERKSPIYLLSNALSFDDYCDAMCNKTIHLASKLILNRDFAIANRERHILSNALSFDDGCIAMCNKRYIFMSTLIPGDDCAMCNRELPLQSACWLSYHLLLSAQCVLSVVEDRTSLSLSAGHLEELDYLHGNISMLL